MKRTVALIFGGEGEERHISVLSARNIYKTIDKEAFAVLPIFISKTGDWYISDGIVSDDNAARLPTYPVKIGGKSGFLQGAEIIPVDVAIPLLHGDFGEDGRIQGALDTAHIRYVGCTVATGAICADKAYTKIAAEHLGIPTARWVLADGLSAARAKSLALSKFDFPMFIKPSGLGSSIGASEAEGECDFEKAYRTARKYSTRILIEEKIPVKYEIECAFLQLNGTRLYRASGSALTNGVFYDYGAKYCGENSPKILHGEALTGKRERIARYARALGDLLGLKDFARLDFFLTEDGRIYFNEINTTPGMTDTSLYPPMTEDMGFAPGEFINRLLGEASL